MLIALVSACLSVLNTENMCPGLRRVVQKNRSVGQMLSRTSLRNCRHRIRLHAMISGKKIKFRITTGNGIVELDSDLWPDKESDGLGEADQSKSLRPTGSVLPAFLNRALEHRLRSYVTSRCQMFICYTAGCRPIEWKDSSVPRANERISEQPTKIQPVFLAASCAEAVNSLLVTTAQCVHCLLYTSPSPRDKRQSRMPSSA